MVRTAAQILADINASGGDVPTRVPVAVRAEQIREMAGRGMSDTEIAAELGCRKQSVQKVRRQLGIPPGLRRGRPSAARVAVLTPDDPALPAERGGDR